MNKTTTKLNKKDAKVKVASAHVRNIRISPRKMRLVTNLINHTWAYDALNQLEFTHKKGSRFVIDMIKSAMANAENNFKLDKENLYIKSITCDAGPKIKRYMPRAQGRASEIRRPLAHIHIILEEKQNTKKRSARFAEIKKADKKPKAATEPQESTKEENAPKMNSQIVRGEQQTKQNKVTQKRRLFNRKSGV